jgi:hypothetical protein
MSRTIQDPNKKDAIIFALGKAGWSFREAFHALEQVEAKARKAERERILGKMQCLRTHQFGDLWYVKPSVYEALKGEGDE